MKAKILMLSIGLMGTVQANSNAEVGRGMQALQTIWDGLTGAVVWVYNQTILNGKGQQAQIMLSRQHQLAIKTTSAATQVTTAVTQQTTQAVTETVASAAIMGMTQEMHAQLLKEIQSGSQGVAGAITGLDGRLGEMSRLQESLKAEMQSVNKNLSGSVTTEVKLTKAQTIMLGACAVASGATLVYYGYKFCGWTKSWFVTSPEEKVHQQELGLRQEQVDAEREKLRSEKVFFDSLVTNKHEPLGQDGLPRGCRTAADAYEKSWGTKALDEQKEAFKKHL